MFNAATALLTKHSTASIDGAFRGAPFGAQVHRAVAELTA